MGNSLKIQTMGGDLDDLKNNHQKEKEDKKSAGKAVSLNEVAKKAESGKSIVESVISSMGNDTPIKNDLETSRMNVKKGSENNKAGKASEINELRNLVNRISKTVPKEDLNKKEFPEVEQIKRKADKEINEEIEKRISKKIDEKDGSAVKENLEKEKANILPADISQKESKFVKQKKNQKGDEVGELKSLIDRISKTAEGDATKIPDKTLLKEEKIKTRNDEVSADAKLSDIKNDILKKPVEPEVEQKKASSKISVEKQKSLKEKGSGVIENAQEEIFSSGETGDAKKSEKSFWADISQKLKKPEIKKPVEIKKNTEIKKPVEIKKPIEIKENTENKIVRNTKSTGKVTEKYSKSGILTEDKEIQQEQEIKDEEKSGYQKDGGYVLPENRLIHGRQRYYSSISKKIETRQEEGKLKGLKNSSDIKEKQKILSREEEYKKLKKNIISRHNIKLFLLPWKKIILVALVIILITASSFYYLMSAVTPDPSPKFPVVTASEEELSEFACIEKKITITEDNLKGFDSLEKDAKDIFSKDFNLKIIKLVIVSTEDKESRKMLSLKDSLDVMNIIDTKNNINNLPEKFLEMTTDNYNLFIFKTNENKIRYGIAIGLKDSYFMSKIMKEWEEDRSKNKKMIAVLKPLFGSDRNYEDVHRIFDSVNYGSVKINYVHLVDEDTALNYFVHDNLLVITTSKDSVLTVIDLLANDQ